MQSLLNSLKKKYHQIDPPFISNKPSWVVYNNRIWTFHSLIPPDNRYCVLIDRKTKRQQTASIDLVLFYDVENTDGTRHKKEKDVQIDG